ncbi:hypothetical protein ACFRQM_41050 [Streptomyces sp. NPDC056831]|uniref:hypothetical protein n=1 Tax=Streptomyces sp. NPDC056831 TaxID=3345954 RepID=UPI003691F935
MQAFFASWRQALAIARKYAVAVRNYVMSKTAYLSGVRASELCQVRLGELFWDQGQWGRFLVKGKGEEIRGLFPDNPSDPHAPLFPSERLATTLVDVPVATAIHLDTFRRALREASLGVSYGAPKGPGFGADTC